MHNLGLSALGNENKRDLETITNIISSPKLNFDIIALQEVLSGGQAFTQNSAMGIKEGILNRLGKKEWGFEWADAGSENDPRHEGFAFIWRKRRLRLCTTKILTSYGEITRTFYPRMCKVNKEDMLRQPYYGRFTANGVLGGTNVEFRLICVHTYYGKSDSDLERQIRQHELDVLMKDIYPQITDRRYGDPMVSYTILLGDYNAELWTKESRVWQEPLKRQRGGRFPAIMQTDEEGVVESNRYIGRRVKTVQDQLTTLKSKANENDNENFDMSGFSYNYDHFSYEEEKFKDVKVHVKRITSVVTEFCKVNNGEYESDFEKYYKTISDHIPIMMEIEL